MDTICKFSAQFGRRTDPVGGTYICMYIVYILYSLPEYKCTKLLGLNSIQFTEYKRMYICAC